MRVDTTAQQLPDIHKVDEDDTDFNAIEVLTERSSLSRRVLDSGANRHIFNSET